MNLPFSLKKAKHCHETLQFDRTALWCHTRQAEREGGIVTDMRSAGWRMGAASLLAAVLSGCISVDAPDGPIVIELNVNIRQEVIYRLADDAANTIEENADIF
ncbi:YnbE family lipoprotein [Altererythrobacter lutimaris]|nr:YnbE family lipoprotein [Altererythrobacter lutimaris]